MILSLLGLSANAQTYALDYAIPYNPPTQRNSVYILRSVEVDLDMPSTEVTSSWSYVTCRYDDAAGRVTVTFEASVTNWPTTIPSSATCAAGRYTLQLDFLDEGGLSDLPESIDSTTTVQLDFPSGSAMVYTWSLPAGLQVVSGDYLGTKGGTDWDDFHCRVATGDSGAALRIEVNPSAAAGNGTCDVPLTEGGTYPVSFALSWN